MTEAKSYSQNLEQEYILEALKNFPTGKFLDIGSYDVFRFSNVRALYEKGYGGVMVEPAPQNYKAIAAHYSDDPKVVVLNVAIGEKTGEIDFYESNGDAVSTSDEEHMEKWSKGGVSFSKIRVPQISAEQFYRDHFDDTVRMISIDTEATNIVVFRNTPDYVLEGIQCLCIEHDGFLEEIEERLSKFGFKTLYTNAENIVSAK